MVPALNSTRSSAATRLQAWACAPAPSRLWRCRVVHEGQSRRHQRRQNKFRYEAPFVDGWSMFGFILIEQFYSRMALICSPFEKLPGMRSVDVRAWRYEMLGRFIVPASAG